ncbi:ATP-binding protein [Aliiglaciecola lipolytica]|uniref:histidine kinase n=1 Tax=Aliiglaciecola lipolytica E3 TaxID=1127673 RepID=K6YD47_9ALTE|nr:ATP-binding protein [Aliiglaciecola lipolytica]GAC16127.1 two-component system, OmpR family, sensor histidine kinase BaeS [Aliiglaciecola lipolytica E3]
MKMTSKLFLILLGLVSTMLVISMSLAQWSFKQGFLEFVSGIEQNRLQRIGVDLVEQYQTSDNSWADVQVLGLDNFINHNRRSNRQPNLPPGANRHQPPAGRPKGSPPPPHRPKPNLGQQDRGELKTAGPPTGLFSNSGELISGEDKSEKIDHSFSYPLYLGKNKIAELRSWPTIEGSYESANLFAQKQMWASLIIGSICLILAGLLSWLVSRKLLQPIKQIIQGVAQLSSGNYSVTFNGNRRDELGELMENVSYLSQTLNQNRSAKNRLFADISHELRTPLTVLTGEIDLLKAGVRPFDMKNLASLQQETERLNHLVEDLYQLSLSDMGALKYNMLHANISDTIERSIQSVEQHAIEKELTINMDIQPDIMLSMDSRRIEQLCLNLLMNAIAYTDSPGQIKVSLRLNKQEILLQINDSKPSVTPNQCEKLFEPLFRLDTSRTNRESGAGLGLTICKNIVEAHHGKISATPSSLGGLCVTVILPLSRGEK